MTKRLVDFFGWCGVLIFFTGGLTLRWPGTNGPQLIEFNQWGLFLCPLMIYSLWRRDFDFSFLKVFGEIGKWLAIPTRAYWVLSVMTVLHLVAVFNRYFSFNAEWDLSIYANACANGLHSSLRNHTTLLADHFEPFLAVFAPACSVMNPNLTLIFVQCLAWFIGSVGVLKLSWRCGIDDLRALLLALVFLIFAGHQTIVYYDFHLYALSLASIPWIVLATLEKRFICLLVLALIHLMFKEVTGLFIFGYGLFLLLSSDRRIYHRSVGVALAVIGFLSFVLVMAVLFPIFRKGVDSEYFVKYYGHFGSNFREFLATVLLSPWRPLMWVLSPERLVYLGLISLPFLLVPLTSLSGIFPVAGALAVAMLSSSAELYSARYHYEAEIYPWFFCLTILLLTAKQHRAKGYQTLTSWILVMIVFFSGVSPLARIDRYQPSYNHAAIATELQRMIPVIGECRTAAVERVATHLSALPNLTMLDQWEKADVIVVAYPQGPRFWLSNFEMVESKIIPEAQKTMVEYHPLAWDKSFRVFISPACEAFYKHVSLL